MNEADDRTIGRIAEGLRPLPHVRPEAVASLLVAVAAERERAREGQQLDSTPRMRRVIVAGVTTALAAGLVGVLLLRGDATVTPSSNAPGSVAATASMVSVAGRGGATDVEGAPRDVEFVLRAPSASHVHVAGDFNGWNQHAAPMRRDSASGLWSATLVLRPGRHVYAFVVDDSVWLPDPRAPVAKDADYGRPGSVLLVGRP